MAKGFKLGLPIVTGQMLLRNKIRLKSHAELMEITSYQSFKPLALTYLVIHAKIDFDICLEFFEKLNELFSQRIKSRRKITRI